MLQFWWGRHGIISSFPIKWWDSVYKSDGSQDREKWYFFQKQKRFYEEWGPSIQNRMGVLQMLRFWPSIKMWRATSQALLVLHWLPLRITFLASLNNVFFSVWLCVCIYIGTSFVSREDGKIWWSPFFRAHTEHPLDFSCLKPKHF